MSELFLGAMTFGEGWGWGAPPEECRRMLDAYAQAGGNVSDTAVNYTDGASERIVGELLSSQRDHFVVATTYTLSRDPNEPTAAGNHRKNLVRSLELSLGRLGTDHVDLYWVHIWDPRTPIEETMRALDDVVRAGKVVYIGISDTSGTRVAADTIVERDLQVARTVRGVADDLGVSPAQVALAWTMARRSSVHPIVGARRLDQLTDNLRAVDVALDAGALDRLDEASAISLGFPHDFIRDTAPGQL